MHYDNFVNNNTALSFSLTIQYQASHSLSDNPTRQGNNCRGKGSHSNIVLKVLKWVFETRIRDRTNTLAGCRCPNIF